MYNKKEVCKICGQRSILIKKLLIVHENYEIYKCTKCNLIFCNLKEWDMTSYYDRYCDEIISSRDLNLRVESERKVVKKTLKFINKFIKGPGLMLDIGCGDGVHLKLFDEHGWSVVGTEVSPKMVDYVSNYYGFKVMLGKIEEIDFKEQFDFIQAKHVLEHLEDPKAFVHKIYSLLKENGIVRIDTPNIGLAGGINYYLCKFNLYQPKEHFGGIKPSEHLFWYSLNSIKYLFNNENFEIIKIIRTHKGDPLHYPLAYKPQYYNLNLIDRFYLFLDRIGSLFNMGDVLVLYAMKKNKTEAQK